MSLAPIEGARLKEQVKIKAGADNQSQGVSPGCHLHVEHLAKFGAITHRADTESLSGREALLVPASLDAVEGRKYDQDMTTREKFLRLVDGMSEAELEAEYQRLLRVSGKSADDDEFEAALEDARRRSERLDLPIDIAALIRDERDRHAARS